MAKTCATRAWPGPAAGLLLLLALLAPAGTAAAPALEEWVAEALARSPALAALRAEVEAAAERIAPAGALPDPMVELMLQDVGVPEVMEMSMAIAQARQRLPYPGKRPAARRTAEAELAVRRAALAAAEGELALAVRRSYAELYAIDGESRALAAGSELIELLEAVTGSRYATGEAGQGVLLEVQLERSRIAERRADLAARRARLAAELDGLLGRPPGQPQVPIDRLPELPEPPPDLAARAATEAPPVRLAEADVVAAEKRLAEAKLALRPDMALAAGGGVNGDAEPVLVLGFGLELPVWRRTRQDPLARAAGHELEAARNRARQTALDAAAEAAALEGELAAAGLQIARYRESILPQSAAFLDAARSEFVSGRGGFSGMIDGFRSWLMARADLARREADRLAAWAGIAYLIGLEPRPKERPRD